MPLARTGPAMARPARRLLAPCTLLLALSLASGAWAEPGRSAARIVRPDKVAAAAPHAHDLRLRGTQALRHGLSRAKVQSMRAALSPAFVWPFSKLARHVGEALVGVREKTAARAASRIASEYGRHVVMGRVGPTYHDKWSAAEAEGSFLRVIDELASARKTNPKLRASIAFDPEYFGIGLHGVPEAQQRVMALEAMVRIARHAREHGVGVEMDMTDLSMMPTIIDFAHHLVREVGVPVRLALPARYEASKEALQDWSALARKTGLRLGVRLVKGSAVQAEREGSYNLRNELIDNYMRMVSLALEHSVHLDVAVATHNFEVAQHAAAEAARTGGSYSIHIIRGMNPAFEERFRRQISAEYVSYGLDAPVFGVTERLMNAARRRQNAKNYYGDLD